MIDIFLNSVKILLAIPGSLKSLKDIINSKKLKKLDKNVLAKLKKNNNQLVQYLKDGLNITNLVKDWKDIHNIMNQFIEIIATLQKNINAQKVELTQIKKEWNDGVTRRANDDIKLKILPILVRSKKIIYKKSKKFNDYKANIDQIIKVKSDFDDIWDEFLKAKNRFSIELKEHIPNRRKIREYFTTMKTTANQILYRADLILLNLLIIITNSFIQIKNSL